MNPSADTPKYDTRKTEQAPATYPAPETMAPEPPALAELVKALQSQAALDAENERRVEQAALVARQRFD